MLHFSRKYKYCSVNHHLKSILCAVFSTRNAREVFSFVIYFLSDVKQSLLFSAWIFCFKVKEKEKIYLLLLWINHLEKHVTGEKENGKIDGHFFKRKTWKVKALEMTSSRVVNWKFLVKDVFDKNVFCVNWFIWTFWRFVDTSLCR